MMWTCEDSYQRFNKLTSSGWFNGTLLNHTLDVVRSKFWPIYAVGNSFCHMGSGYIFALSVEDWAILPLVEE